MTEMSYWWTTGGAGDGASTYTRANLTEVSNILGGASYWEGVVPTYRNELVGTVGGANTFNINTGGGIVDGKPYESDASVGVTIPSTSSDTRIDRVVVRADWTAQTVRITRIAGSESATPSAPSITQTSGATYDIMLYQVNVDSSGTVTIEADERVWAIVPVDETTIENLNGELRVKTAGITAFQIAAGAVDTDELATDAVTAAKIEAGAVDTAELAALAVTTAKIAAGAVDTTELATDAVTAAKIEAGAVGTTEIAAGAVDTDELATDAVTAVKIVTRAVGQSELGLNSVTAAHIVDGQVDTDELAALAVTTAKLAADAVDDTKAGDRVPQFYRRQGGSATIWSTQGATTYTPGAVRMQGGVIRWSGSSTDSGSMSVTFPTAFSYAPLVIASAQNTTLSVTVVVSSIATTGFTAYWRDTEAANHTTVDAGWLAIGPE